MLIANRLRENNRAEYLLYMWQVEDIIRANDQWYALLCEMMRSEGKTQSGHLQINLNVV